MQGRSRLGVRAPRFRPRSTPSSSVELIVDGVPDRPVELRSSTPHHARRLRDIAMPLTGLVDGHQQPLGLAKTLPPVEFDRSRTTTFPGRDGL